MKIKVLTVLGLAAFMCLGGCRSTANTNMANANMMNSNMTMTTPMATMTPMMDMNTQKTVESALTKAGITGVMVSADASSITLRGTVADKAKMAEAVRVAQQAGNKPVKNELTEMTKK